MDEDTFKTNLNSLKEIILDEHKLVTYGSLSKDLCIHVNDSKKLLLSFVENVRNKEPDFDLNVIYIISGLSEDNKARTTLSLEKELDGIRKSLKTVFFEHIYCVSKGVPSVDKVALLSVSQFGDLPLCIGLIKSNFCVKRSADEIRQLQSNSQVTVQAEKKLNILPKTIKEENQVPPKEDPKIFTKVPQTKSEPIIKAELPSPKKEPSTSKVKPDNKKNGAKTQKGIAGFFGKSNSAPSKLLSKTMVEDKHKASGKNENNLVPNIKTEKMDVDDEVNTHVKEVKQNNSKPEIKPEQLNGKPKNKANNKLKQIKKNAKVDKKRKRVLHVSDSESGDEKDPFVDDSEKQEQDMSEDEIPPTPTVNTVKITSGIVNPKKRRKIVDKTYEEDGFILTKKEEVYESCSDNEEEISAKENIKAPLVNQVKEETSTTDKKNGPKNSKKKISPPQKGKQSTMMNFFKKV